VPEVIAAVHSGLRALAVSLISDLCIPETLKPVDIKEIIAVATKAEPMLTKLFTGIIERLATQRDQKPVTSNQIKKKKAPVQ
jgi:purine-nucleoside phosphorylase